MGLVGPNSSLDSGHAAQNELTQGQEEDCAPARGISYLALQAPVIAVPANQRLRRRYLGSAQLTFFLFLKLYIKLEKRRPLSPDVVEYMFSSIYLFFLFLFSFSFPFFSILFYFLFLKFVIVLQIDGLLL